MDLRCKRCNRLTEPGLCACGARLKVYSDFRQHLTSRWAALRRGVLCGVRYFLYGLAVGCILAILYGGPGLFFWHIVLGLPAPPWSHPAIGAFVIVSWGLPVLLRVLIGPVSGAGPDSTDARQTQAV